MARVAEEMTCCCTGSKVAHKPATKKAVQLVYGPPRLGCQAYSLMWHWQWGAPCLPVSLCSCASTFSLPQPGLCLLQLFRLQTALRDANIAIYGGERSCKYLSLPPAPSPKHEYGTAALTLELVDSMEDAINHLHANGSGHTECIVTGMCLQNTTKQTKADAVRQS